MFDYYCACMIPKACSNTSGPAQLGSWLCVV
jgi:hypothetical protein